MNFLQSIRVWLELNLGAGSAFGVLSIVVFLVVFGLRKAFPRQWEALVSWMPSLAFDEKPVMAILVGAARLAIQTIPGAVIGAVLGAFSTGGDPKAAALAALATGVAAAMHHAFKALPFIPYTGKVGAWERKDPSSPS